jgi:hypothetical protein
MHRRNFISATLTTLVALVLPWKKRKTPGVEKLCVGHGWSSGNIGADLVGKKITVARADLAKMRHLRKEIMAQVLDASYPRKLFARGPLESSS